MKIKLMVKPIWLELFHGVLAVPWKTNWEFMLELVKWLHGYWKIVISTPIIVTKIIHSFDQIYGALFGQCYQICIYVDIWQFFKKNAKNYYYFSKISKPSNSVAAFCWVISSSIKLLKFFQIDSTYYLY